MKAYKGFDKDMKCLGFQFEEGKTYEEKEANLCKRGFHACLAPLDVLRYYAPCDDNGNLRNFHEVELDDVSDEKADDSKVVAKKIKIGAALDFFGLAKAHIEYVKEHIEPAKEENSFCDCSVAGNAGNYSVASNAGNYSVASNAGARSVASNTGNYSAATNTGDRSAASNTGYCSVASNAGARSVASNTGNYSAATNTGDRSAASNTGNYSAASNTGNYSAASNTGENGIAVAWGRESKAKGALGCYIVLAEYGDWNGAEYPLINAKMHKVDGKTIKPDTWYKLKNGKFVKAEK